MRTFGSNIVESVKTESQDEREQEAQLVASCRNGDRTAFNEVIRVHQQKVFRTAYRLLRDYHQAEEVAQDVFVRAYRGMRHFRGDARLSSWLYKITVNLCRNKIRQNMRRREHEYSLSSSAEDSPPVADVPDSSFRPDTAAVTQDQRRLIQAAIARLPEEFREVFILRDIEGLAYEEIAEAVGVNQGTVKSRLHRARQQLRGQLRGVV